MPDFKGWRNVIPRRRGEEHLEQYQGLPDLQTNKKDNKFMISEFVRQLNQI